MMKEILSINREKKFKMDKFFLLATYYYKEFGSLKNHLSSTL